VTVLWYKILNNFKAGVRDHELDIEGCNFMSTIKPRASVTC